MHKAIVLTMESDRIGREVTLFKANDVPDTVVRTLGIAER